MPVATSVTPFTSGQEEENFIRSAAAQLGLDADAVLAVAAHEGVTLPAEVGDSGTSFGPWQLHQGGRLPSAIASRGAQYADEWANSPAGITYALQGIKGSVGSRRQGLAEIAAQILNFERPTNPGAEFQGAAATYQAHEGPSIGTGLSTQGLSTTGLSGPGTQQTPPYQGLPTPGTKLSPSQIQQIGNAVLSGHLSEAQAQQDYGLHGGSFDIHPIGAVQGAASGVWKDVEPWILRGFEIILGLGLIGLAMVGIFKALTQTEAAQTVATFVAPAQALIPEKAPPLKPDRPISQQSRRVRRNAGFTAASIDKDGSYGLSQGDEIPF